MTDKEKRERIEEIEKILERLEKEKKELEYERRSLLYLEANETETQILDSLPVRAYNAIYRAGIHNDIELLSFFEGDASFMKPRNTLGTSFEKAKRPLERLLAIRNMGQKSAKEVIRIYQKHGFLLEEEH